MKEPASFAELVHRIASEIAEILESLPIPEAPPYFADLALNMASVVIERPEQFANLYCSLEWWGGSGSMADLHISDKALRRRQLELMIELVNLCDSSGVDCPRAQRWAGVFEAWLRNDVV